MHLPRYLCSELVTVTFKEAATVVNLEEIWESGCVFESEIAFEAGAEAGIEAGSARFSGTVSRVEAHPTGWRVEMEFSPLTPWRVSEFTPKHLLDLASLKAQSRPE